MLNERDFIRLRQPRVGEWTQARSTPIPAGAVLVEDVSALLAGAVRPDIPDPAPVPANEQPLPELIYVDPAQADPSPAQPGGATETAPATAPKPPLRPRTSPEQNQES